MSKRIKNMLVDDLRQRLGSCRDILVVDYSRLNGVTETDMRLKLRKQNIRMLGVKNSLARKVLGELGLSGLDPYLSGPSTLVFGGPDIVALSKEIAKWAKNLEPLQIKGGIVDGTSVNSAEIDALSKSPSREELLGKIVMLALSPGAQLAALLLGSAGTLAGQVKSIADKEADNEPETESAAATAT
ncbi:MAG: 50S ribosomal protein L10 [Planctomycetaceae bacterium]|nr:50S ribosomal protein L10 [Planctomycetaceae bacterium]